MIDSVLKTNHWTYEIKNFNGETIIGSFYEKELLLSKLKMNYYPKPASYIGDKDKVVLRLLNYATKKHLNDATGFDTSNLAAKRDFIALKAEVDKLEINELVNFSTSLNNLKRKLDDLDIGKLKIVPINFLVQNYFNLN